MKKVFLWTIFIYSLFIINFSLADETTAQLKQLPQGLTEISPAEGTTAQLKPLTKSPTEVPHVSEGLKTRISLDLRNIEIVEALKFLSMKAEMNIITTKNVEGRITLLVQDVPVQDILDVMLRSNELAYTKEGRIYNVMTAEEYKALFGKKFADVRQVKVFRLKYTIPDQAFTLLDTLKS